MTSQTALHNDAPIEMIGGNPSTIEATASSLAARHGSLPAPSLLRAMIEREFPGRIALVSSFGAESATLLHMVAQIDASMPVLFINTEKLFPETIFYRDLLVQQLGLKDTREIRPDPATLAEHDPDGKLWKRNPDFCCLLRKTQPLDTALSGFSAWITGRKQIHGGARQSLAVIEAADGRIKINPLAHWSQDDLDSYAADHELPAHPLVEHGYQSVGCMPCTQPVLRGENPRDGRWRGTNKVECGIHLPRTRFDRPRENS